MASGTATSTTISGGAQYVGVNFGTGTATARRSTTAAFSTSARLWDRDGDEHDDRQRRQLSTSAIDGDGDGDEHDDQRWRHSVRRRSRWDRDGDEHDDRQRRQSVRRRFDDGIGYATSTTIYSGGYQYVGDGLGAIGTATSTTISGGAQYVSSGGTADDDIVYSGGLADILSGGVANSPVIDGGTLELAAGAIGRRRADRLRRGRGRQRGNARPHRRGLRPDFHPGDLGLHRHGRHGGGERPHRRRRFSGRRRRPSRLDPGSGSGTLEVETSGGQSSRADARRDLSAVPVRTDRPCERRSESTTIPPSSPRRSRARSPTRR